MNQDYKQLVDNGDHADIAFVLDNSLKQKIPAHKALILYRQMEKEMKI